MPAAPRPDRDLQAIWIADDTLSLRSRSRARLRFEIEYGLERGTTSNSYLIRGDRTILINPPGASFTDAFLAALEQRQPIEDIDYVLLGHLNPNRIATLKALRRRSRTFSVVCSNPGARILQTLWEAAEGEEPLPPLCLDVVRGEQSLDLGNGHQLTLLPTPTPRWPGGLAAFDSRTGLLYSDKLFGAHLWGDQVADEGWPLFVEDQRYYFDALMAPQWRQIARALDRFSDLPLQAIAPSHGPIARYGLTELLRHYREWGARVEQQDLRVALLYASAYGSTAAIGQAIAQGMSKAGVQVESINCETAADSEVRQALGDCDGFVIGSPTLGGHAPTPIQTALGTILEVADRSRLAGVFGSYGWSGEAIDLLETKLRDGGFRFGFEPIRVQFKADARTLKACEEAGTDFAQALRKQKQKAERASRPTLGDSQSEATEQAAGRLLGSLSILTARKGDVSSAMLASWISQASFDPPGLTVAVARDRAVEDLTHKGDRFVVNILAEGRSLGLMKHFLKPFGPGEDRFEGVAQVETVEASAPVLAESLAWLQCRVSDRMECGDHWLVYATIEEGGLLDGDGRTAIHHRTNGRFY